MGSVQRTSVRLLWRPLDLLPTTLEPSQPTAAWFQGILPWRVGGR